MFLLRFFRFLTGYIVFSGTGGFSERFLNLCSLNNITIWDIRSQNGSFTAKTSISCYKKIRPCAKRSGMKLKATAKCGLPFIIRPYTKRKGLIAGAALSLVIVTILSSCVWTINVSGNEKYTDEQILSLAGSYGITPGAFRSSIDPKAIRENIKATVDGINWFSVNIDKTAVSLEVLESTGSSEILDLSTPCNIVSSVDGELLSLEVYTGDAAVTPGNAVTKGDLLISGVVERADGSSDFVHARGNAVIRTKKEITKTIASTEKCYYPSENDNGYSVYIFSLVIPVKQAEEKDLSRTEKEMLQYDSLKLPLGIITHSETALIEKDLALDSSRSALLCGYCVFCQEQKIMQNAETESKTVTVSQSDNETTVTISYINHEKSGIEYYFIVEDN